MESAKDDESLTKAKQKKPRSEAQQESTKKMLSALEEKKLKLKALKDKLNNAPPIPVSDSEEEEAPPPVVVKKAKVVAEPKAVAEPPTKTKKEPKVVYESASESEEEVVIVKKKKKPKRKTIIYEESDSEEEEVVQPKKGRETKTQQNSKSASFKVSLPETKPAKPQPLYYFAD